MANYPIITSLMDIDFYKFTMGYIVFKKYKGTKVRYKLFDRKHTGIGGKISIDELSEQLDFVKTLKFSRSELHYLRGTNEYSNRMFDEDYLEFLSNLKLPDYELSVNENGDLDLEFYGTWEEAIYWETIAMSIINELYFNSLKKNYSKLETANILAEGFVNLKNKMDKLSEKITIADFGTRRRYSKKWHEIVLDNIIDYKNVNLVGTSNTFFANMFGLMPIGTFAHELEMGVSGMMYDDLVGSHYKVIFDWWEIFGYGLSIALSDTFTTKFFLDTFGEQNARDWKGVRHDSGDPYEFGERMIKFYDNYGIDPRTKLIIFSDGLDINTILKLQKQFDGRIKTSYGWGTNLTNDVGFNTLGIVIKLIESNGNPVVKLSDMAGKIIGEEEAVNKYLKAFTKCE